MRPHKLVEKDLPDGSKVYAIQFTSMPLEGIIFSYDEVKLTAGEDSATLKFSYTIHKEPDVLYSPMILEKNLGDFLQDKMRDQIEKGELIYKSDTPEPEPEYFKDIKPSEGI